MLMGIAREQVRNILEFLSESDLRVIELKIVPGTPRSSSTTERVDAILSCASQPSEILLQRSMRKSVLRRYLWQNGINVTPEQPKSDYVRILLVMWQVQDDDFLAKISRLEEKAFGDLSRLDSYMSRTTEEISREHCIKMNKAPKTLEAVQEQNILLPVKKQKEYNEEVRSLSPTEDLAKSLDIEHSNSKQESLHIKKEPPTNITSERKYESPTSYFGVFRDGTISSQGTFDCIPSVSTPDGNNSISSSVIACCSSESVNNDNERQSTFLSKMQNFIPSGDKLYSEVMPQEQPSTEPFRFSPQSLDTNRLPSICTVKNECKSIRDTLNHEEQHFEDPQNERDSLDKKSRNDLSPLSKRKNCAAGFSDAKRDRLTWWSSRDDCTPGFRNTNRNQLTLPSNSVEHCSSSFLNADGKELDFSSKSLGNKKRSPTTVPKEATSSKKQRRLSASTKRAREVSVTSLTLVPKTKTCKTKCPTSSSSSSSKATSVKSYRGRSTISPKQPFYTLAMSKCQKQSKLPFTKKNKKSDKASTMSSTEHHLKLVFQLTLLLLGILWLITK